MAAKATLLGCFGCDVSVLHPVCEHRKPQQVIAIGQACWELKQGLIWSQFASYAASSRLFQAGWP